MNLLHILRTSPTAALVGAGGKTTALFQLARQFDTALVTPTTHLGTWQAAGADHHFILKDTEDVAVLETDLPSGVILLTGAATPDGERLTAIGAAALERIHTLSLARRIPLFLEADGSRQHPLKAPAEYEPVIPPWVETVIVVAGLSGLGQPLTPAWVHRPERFSALSGLNLGDPISPEALVCVLLHPQGGLKSIPPTARRVLLFNQAASPLGQATAQRMADALLPVYHAVVIADLPEVFAVHEPTAAIILAAGEARRFGRPKQLLAWDGEPLVRRAARVALQAGLAPVIVVTGAYADEVEPVLAGLNLRITRCEMWREGQSASIRAGLHALPPETGAAAFLLADQPFVPATLLQTLRAAHARSLAPVVAPLIDGQRGNPVLFDHQTFPALMALTGDVGGRAIFSDYPIEWVPWHDAAVLKDINTPEDYAAIHDAL
jgi:molybdenum cofactor cytidylyltransferase